MCSTTTVNNADLAVLQTLLQCVSVCVCVCVCVCARMCVCNAHQGLTLCLHMTDPHQGSKHHLVPKFWLQSSTGIVNGISHAHVNDVDWWGCLHEAMLRLAVQDMPRRGSHLHQLGQISGVSSGSRECSRVGRKSLHRCIPSTAASCLFDHRVTCAICQ